MIMDEIDRLRKMIAIKTDMIIQTLTQKETLEKFEINILQIQAMLIKRFSDKIYKETKKLSKEYFASHKGDEE